MVRCYLPETCCDIITRETIIRGFLRPTVANTWGIVRLSWGNTLRVSSNWFKSGSSAWRKKTNECKNCHMKWLSVLQGTLPHSLVTACLCSSRRLWLNSHVGDSTIMELKRYWSVEIINEMKKTKRQVDGAASVIPATCVNMIPRTIASWVRTPNAFD